VVQISGEKVFNPESGHLGIYEEGPKDAQRRLSANSIIYSICGV
jgi:hypothetical protein